MKGYYLDPDPEIRVSDECYAVVYAPRRKRDRFPQGCVEVVDSEAAARAGADAAANRHAARVIGPAKSSEGQYVFHLLAWLD